MVIALSALMATRPTFGALTFGSSARRSTSARVAGVLLAPTASLATARPASRGSVVPFSHEFTRTRRKLGYVMDNDSIRTARDAWLADATAAEATYGHISTWETGGVTDMSELFRDASSFNEDIGAWDTSGVTSMYRMFNGASAFDQYIGAWSVENVRDMHHMFNWASSFNQNIGGWRVDNDVNLDNAFYNTLCASTSCGVTQSISGGGICVTLAPTFFDGAFGDKSIRTAVDAWLANATTAEAAYGHISTWETGEVTDMKQLFQRASSFNEDIGAWDTSGVKNMNRMFNGASAFDQDLGGWAVQSVTRMSMMFYEATAFNQDLGWCVDDGVDLDRAFSFTKCVSTSCGVFQKDVIGICYSACLISNQHGHCVIHTHLIIIISIVLALFAGVGRYVHMRKNADETYAAAARRVLCRRGTKVRAISEEAPALPASTVRVVDAEGIAPNELGTVVAVKHNPPTDRGRNLSEG